MRSAFFPLFISAVAQNPTTPSRRCSLCSAQMPKRKTRSSTRRKQSSTDGVVSHERSWSELPEEILHLFSKKLPDISDFIRFRAVCKRWQLSAPVTDPLPPLPWLLECRDAYCENDMIRFYCFSSGKVHTITCPASHRAKLQGPACRYLLATHLGNCERYLLNPLTHDRICVPSFVVGGGCPEYIGPDPIEGGDIVVISGYWFVYMQQIALASFMAFRRSEADNWVFVEGISAFPSSNVFYSGQYFSNDFVTGITNVIDITTKKMVYQVVPPADTNPLQKGTTIIVESGGKILRLFQHYEDEQCHFDIYCLYFGDGEPKPYWMKITEIGDQILFLQNYHGLSFCASNFVGLKGNCIYFLKDTERICRYDIGDGTTQVLPCPFDSVETWFVPSLVSVMH